jgi:DNA (cytosine-5)-methyltransferase 1
LEAEGYEVQPFIIPAAAKNAPHRRDRVWFIAYSNSGTKRSSRKSRGVKIDRCQNNDESFKWRKPTQFDIGRYEFLQNATNADGIRSVQWDTRNIGKLSERNRFKALCKSTNWEKFPTQSPICGGNDGLPTQLDGITFPKWRAESIKGYGNAIVPQIAFEIFKIIKIHITDNQ